MSNIRFRLIEILGELIEVERETKLNISDEVIFSEACSFLRGELAGKSKEIKNLEPASVGQLDYLKVLGYKGNMKITKKEAMELIKELKR